MTKVSTRKTRLTFETDAEIRMGGREKKKYVQKMRPIIIEVNNGYVGTVRLKGTRIRYEFSWHGLHDFAAELHARREKARRKKEREERRKARL